MDLRYSSEYDVFRREVRAFLERSWPPPGADPSSPEAIAAFRQAAIERGYFCRSVPRKYGGSEQAPDPLQATIIREECARARAPIDNGPGMLVLTLLDRGSEWQKDKFVPTTLRGEIRWCQGYSEPGSGSDLASLQTRAELRGDEWVINGQKIWTTGAHVADYMFCLARTEPDAPKHAGISYLLLSMKQPGVEVRPLRQMTGHAHFNEVFLTDARTPADWIVGKRGEGWLVSRTTLKHERNGIGNAETMKTSFAALVALAKRASGGSRITKPELRQRLAALEGYVRSHECSGYIQLTRNAHGRDPGVLQTMNKLVGTNIGHQIARLAQDMLGDDVLLKAGPRDPGRAPQGAAGWVAQIMGSLGTSIAGGTANIQRNVIAERGLGLPRDEHAQRSK
jgi:alkylation response protein AidB-like acyl-CoA dehydrogenase